MKSLINILIVVLLSQVWGCKKDCGCSIATNPDCDNYNPCLGQNKSSADFYSYYQNLVNPNDPYVDSVFSGGRIYFSAEKKNVMKQAIKILK